MNQENNPLDNTQEEGSPPPSSPSPGKRAPSETVPTERLSFSKQLECIQAFGAAQEAAGGPVDNKAAGSIIGISKNSVVYTNPFFTDIGLLTRVGGGKFDVAHPVHSYQQALGWNDANAGHKLRPLFEDKWFTQVLLPRLKMRSYSLSEACAVLAEAAGGASKHYLPNLERIIYYLDLVGLCKVEGDKVSAVMLGGEDKKPDQEEKKEPPIPETKETPVDASRVIPDDAPFMFLDRERKRKVTLMSPDSLTQVEVDKIKLWLELVVHVEKQQNETNEN